MFIWDKKKALTTIMSRHSPDGTKTMEPTPMKMEVVKDADGEVDGRHLAAQGALAAINEKSPERFMESMKNFMDLHMAKRDEKDTPAGPKDSGN